MSVTAEVAFNKLPAIARRFPSEVNRRIRQQVFTTEGDVKTNIVAYDAVDSGNMLGSTRGEMTGQLAGQVSVSAESEDGYPYPQIVNSGGVFVPPRPFFDEALDKARDEFSRRFSDMEGSLA